MNEWIVEFELICRIMSKEIEKRKILRDELKKLYDEFDEKSRNGAEIVELREKIGELEAEHEKSDYMIKRLKEEYRIVLED